MSEPRYVDQKGNPIEVGSILKYDENRNGGDEYPQQIHVVVKRDGVLCGDIRVGEPKWSLVKDDDPVPLRYYQSSCTNDGVCIDVEVIGHISSAPELVTPEAAEQLFTRHAESEKRP